MYYPFVRKALFQLDPERAHEFTFQQLRRITGTPFEALVRPQADEQDIVRIDINHDIANVTEQCRQAVLAIRQNRICAKEGSASDQRCE